MKEKRKSYTAIIIFSCIFLFLWCCLYFQNKQILTSLDYLENEWTFSLNGQLAEKQPSDTLASYIFPTVKKNDTVTLTRPLSATDSTPHQIAFDTWHMVTNVYIDEQLIYTWGSEYHEKGQMLGSARHSVTLPAEYTGKTLTLELFATEDNPMPYLTSVAYYSPGNTASIWFNRPINLLLTGALFVFLGLCIIFISCSLVRTTVLPLHDLSSGKDAVRHSTHQADANPIMLGICIAFTGIYILSRGNFIQLIIPDPQVYNAIEYLSLFAIPIPIMLYWYHDAKARRQKALQISYFVCTGATICFVLCTWILNFASPIHLCQVLPIYYMIVFFVAVVIVFLTCLRDKSEDIQRRKIYIWGILSFIFGSILSIAGFRLCYNETIASVTQLWKWYNYILPFSMCILVFFFSMAFYLDMKLLLENAYRNDLLSYIAYNDALTQLHNRRKFNDDIELLTASHYALINIDLNGLKYVNDTIGHNTGDVMLSSFASLLSDVCGKTYNTYRIGGDEFAILIAEASETVCRKLTEKLYEKAEEFNAQPHEFQMSFACGYATSLEADSFDHVFTLADKRMYEKKMEMKTDL